VTPQKAQHRVVMGDGTPTYIGCEQFDTYVADSSHLARAEKAERERADWEAEARTRIEMLRNAEAEVERLKERERSVMDDSALIDENVRKLEAERDRYRQLLEQVADLGQDVLIAFKREKS
jgi:hypothetical protein